MQNQLRVYLPDPDMECIVKKIAMEYFLLKPWQELKTWQHSQWNAQQLVKQNNHVINYIRLNTLLIATKTVLKFWVYVALYTQFLNNWPNFIHKTNKGVYIEYSM